VLSRFLQSPNDICVSDAVIMLSVGEIVLGLAEALQEGRCQQQGVLALSSYHGEVARVQ
jgi:hypothetical protein